MSLRQYEPLFSNVNRYVLMLTTVVYGGCQFKVNLGLTFMQKYVFDVTSIGQRSSPWTCESRDKFHLECKLHFASAQPMLRQMHLTNVSESIEAEY